QTLFCLSGAGTGFCGAGAGSGTACSSVDGAVMLVPPLPALQLLPSQLVPGGQAQRPSLVGSMPPVQAFSTVTTRHEFSLGAPPVAACPTPACGSDPHVARSRLAQRLLAARTPRRNC